MGIIAVDISDPKQSMNNIRFDRNGNVDFSLERRRIRLLLTRRLSEKIANYERAAVALDEQGDTDAASVLYQAARKLRTIKRRSSNRKLDR